MTIFMVEIMNFWKEKAYEKLPALKNATKMLACGEDLGMVPDNVPDVMYHLDILRLIIERCLLMTVCQLIK